VGRIANLPRPWQVGNLPHGLPLLPLLPVIAAAPARHHQDALAVRRVEEAIVFELKRLSWIERRKRRQGLHKRRGKGMDVVDAIAKVETGIKDMHQNVPVEPVIIKSAKVVSKK